MSNDCMEKLKHEDEKGKNPNKLPDEGENRQNCQQIMPLWKPETYYLECKENWKLQLQAMKI